MTHTSSDGQMIGKRRKGSPTCQTESPVHVKGRRKRFLVVHLFKTDYSILVFNKPILKMYSRNFVTLLGLIVKEKTENGRETPLVDRAKRTSKSLHPESQDFRSVRVRLTYSTSGTKGKKVVLYPHYRPQDRRWNTGTPLCTDGSHRLISYSSRTQIIWTASKESCTPFIDGQITLLYTYIHKTPSHKEKRSLI